MKVVFTDIKKETLKPIIDYIYSGYNLQVPSSKYNLGVPSKIILPHYLSQRTNKHHT